MSKIEDDTAAHANRRRSVDDSGDIPAVVPESDWSVDDDVDPRPRKRRPAPAKRVSRTPTDLDDTGQVPKVTPDTRFGEAAKSSPNADESSRDQLQMDLPRSSVSERSNGDATTTKELRAVDFDDPPTRPVVDDGDDVTNAFDGEWGSDFATGQHRRVSDFGTPSSTMAIPEADPHAPRRRRVRRVNRVLRHVDPWSTFKVGLLFNIIAYLVVMTAGYLLWNVAKNTGTLGNVERWFTQFGWETFEFNGGEIFRNAAVAGIFAAVGLTGALVMFATIFNLVSDAIGGIRVSVLEEEVVVVDDDSTVGSFSGGGYAPVSDWDIDEF